MAGRGAAMLITALAAAGLLALGIGLGWEWRQSEVINLREAALRQGNRAGELLAQIQSIEQRLEAKQAELKRCRRGGGPPAPTPPRETEPTAGFETKVLLRGNAQLALGGRVSLTLQEVSPGEKQAALLLRVLGGGEGRAVLAPGESKTFTLNGARWYLVLKSVRASSATVALVPARRP